jgi:tetratricopeptide (TPR) repeat protein
MGNQDEAISYYNKAMEIAPPIAKIYADRWFFCGKRDLLLWRGEAYSNKADYDRAIADYTRALDKKSTGGPVYGQLYYRRALAHYVQGDYSRARSDVDQALKYKYPVDSDFITKLSRSSK